MPTPSSQRGIPAAVYIENAIKARARGDEELALRILLALRVRDLRKARGWSQQDLADELGWSQPKVSDLENPDSSSRKKKKRLWNDEVALLAATFELTDQEFRNGLGRTGEDVTIKGATAVGTVEAHPDATA